MHRYLILVIALAGFLTSCRPSGPAAFAVTVPPTPTPAQVAQAQRSRSSASDSVTLVPTLNRQPSRTPTATLTTIPTNTPRPTLTPTIARTPIPINSPTPRLSGSPTDEEGTPPPTWTPPPDDPATRIDDHYYMYRPIDADFTNWVDRTYPYGGTQGGQLQTHHGVEFINTRGTPVLAVAEGKVVYAGEDQTQQFGPSTNYYGRLVVIEHPFRAAGGEPVFSLYGHLERVLVETGEPVIRGQEIGLVGDAGVAYGPHLHFEVRVGDPTSFAATRNPELWIFPFGGFGTLAGRVTDADGSPLYDVTIQVRSPNVARYAFSYADDSVNGDSVFGENFALGDLPANYYDVSVTADGRVRFRRMVYVYPNRTTWVDIQLSP